MKQKILLLLGAFICVAAALAQKTAMYAITGTEKGKNGWSEVRLVDYNTGNEVKSVYRNNQEIELLNARTGKPVVVQNTEQAARMQAGKPFATTSAACAYDKKHDRLYYTPMGINELRYIDMKSRTPKIYYFQDEAFGPLKAPRDIPNQITRMVIASNGNGYALTNDAHHLIQFTTSKRPVITDLGSITDAPSNTVSIHNGGGYGGDMVADTKENLYLVTANRHVFKISIETRVAEYLGQIKGLPRGFTTNGAAVEEGT
ncbi:MAG TPA: hypothetical protein VFZ78_03685, partial [Flavisolibacter sp.]